MDKLNELLRNKDVMNQMLKVGSPRDAYDLLTQNGLTCDYETFIEFAEASALAYEKQKAGLLSEEDMDNLLDTAYSSEMVGTPWILFFIICKT